MELVQNNINDRLSQAVTASQILESLSHAVGPVVPLLAEGGSYLTHLDHHFFMNLILSSKINDICSPTKNVEYEYPLSE